MRDKRSIDWIAYLLCGCAIGVAILSGINRLTTMIIGKPSPATIGIEDASGWYIVAPPVPAGHA